MQDQHASPIFIHSLFRAGSTYIFNVFRRSAAGYWCYQEPLSERVLYNAEKPGGFLAVSDRANKALRHPEIDKPYFYEYHVVRDEVLRLFKKDFSYELYFARENPDFISLNSYFAALRDGARGRPVFQCCRTTGRVQGLKKEFPGPHIFLWRNPWDQWWSYKNDHYFDSRNLFILDARDLPSFLKALKNELKIPDLNGLLSSERHAYFTHRRIDPVSSYKIFYALWCHAFLEAKPLCDLSINIDHLSMSTTYRHQILDQLRLLGVSGINFDDCAIPIAAYGEIDGEFFLKAESRIHELLLLNGYTGEKINELIQTRIKQKESLRDTSDPKNFYIRDAMHIRKYALNMESRLSEMQSLLFVARSQAQQGLVKNKSKKL